MKVQTPTPRVLRTTMTSPCRETGRERGVGIIHIFCGGRDSLSS